jgi:hypothetical protein
MRAISITSIPEPAIILFIKLQHFRETALGGGPNRTQDKAGKRKTTREFEAGSNDLRMFFHTSRKRGCIKGSHARSTPQQDSSTQSGSPMNST